MVSPVLFSHENEEFETPQVLWDEWDLEFDFDLDAAATEQNTKVPIFLTQEDNALECRWYNPQEGIRTIWVNPPYGRNVWRWVEKAYEESQLGATVVMLLPARTDTAWFHKWILGRTEIRFLRGRMTFELEGKPVMNLNKKTGKLQKGKAPFPSMLVVFRPPHQRSW